MKKSKPFSGDIAMLILKLLENEDMYGYQMIEELSRRSNNVFFFYSGTLYPLLHLMEQEGLLISSEKSVSPKRKRNYYKLTKNGLKLLREKESEWFGYSNAIKQVLQWGRTYASA